MPYPSGLSAQFVAKAETTVGTPVTVDTAFEFLSESIAFTPTDLDGAGLAAGQAYERGSRNTRSRVAVAGDVTIEVTDKGHMGLLLKHCLGSALTVPVVIGATTAYDQYHTDGPHAGMGLTCQVGRPTGLAVVSPFTYNGCKIVAWELSITDGQILQLKMTIDGWNEATGTTLVTASYTAGAGVFGFQDATVFKIGGVATTTAGKTTVASGVQVANIITGFTLAGTNPMKVDSYGLGNAGVKSEQKENAFPQLTGSLTAEFTNRTELYDLFKANTPTVLQLDMSHFDVAGKDAGGVAAGPNPYLFSIILPQIKFKNGAVNVSGPDVVAQKIDFKLYDDGTTNPNIQIHLVSSDTTL